MQEVEYHALLTAYQQQGLSNIEAKQKVKQIYLQDFIARNPIQIYNWDTANTMATVSKGQEKVCIGSPRYNMVLSGSDTQNADNLKNMNVVSFPYGAGGQILAHTHSILYIVTMPEWAPLYSGKEFIDLFITPVVRSFEIENLSYSDRNDLLLANKKVGGGVCLVYNGYKNFCGVFNFDNIEIDTETIAKYCHGKAANHEFGSLPIAKEDFIEQWGIYLTNYGKLYEPLAKSE